MDKKQTYLFIFAMAITIVFIGQFMNISFINRLTINTWTWMENPYIFVPAGICAFLFMNNKKYWGINTTVAVITSLVIQYIILGSSGTLYILFVRAFAFIVVVFLLNLIKVVLDK